MHPCSETQRTNACTHVQTHVLAGIAPILEWDPAEFHLSMALRTSNIRLSMIARVADNMLRVWSLTKEVIHWGKALSNEFELSMATPDSIFHAIWDWVRELCHGSVAELQMAELEGKKLTMCLSSLSLWGITQACIPAQIWAQVQDHGQAENQPHTPRTNPESSVSIATLLMLLLLRVILLLLLLLSVLLKEFNSPVYWEATFFNESENSFMKLLRCLIHHGSESELMLAWELLKLGIEPSQAEKCTLAGVNTRKALKKTASIQFFKVIPHDWLSYSIIWMFGWYSIVPNSFLGLKKIKNPFSTFLWVKLVHLL